MTTDGTATTTPAPLKIPRTLTVRELSDLLKTSPVQVIKALMTNGIMADVNKTIDFDTAAIIAVDMGFEPAEAGDVLEQPNLGQVTDLFEEETPDEAATLKSRPPVIAMLGHVDHGKTSLLDAIRAAKVQAGEAGGITQRIGAYQATVQGRLITFLDTPGHEAFTQIRARGAEATDIAILVVAANDGVQPQTREAIDHIRAAGAPIVVALNKMDQNNANPDRVKSQLGEANVLVEEYGGDVPLAPVSAVTREGIDALLDTILLVADLQNFKANPERLASGVVLEAELSRQQGPRTTLLVQRGTLHVGDALLVGETWGRIKAMFDFTGERIEEALPSMPVSVLGIQAVAQAGDRFQVLESEREVRRLYEQAKREREAMEAQLQHAASLDALFDEIRHGDVKDLNLILKTDVEGSVEPLRDSLEGLSNSEVHVKVIHAAPGAASESDINLALAARGIVIAFNTGTEPGARKLAEAEKVEIRNYTVIYELLEQVQAAISGMLAPVDVDIVDAHAEVLQVFPIRRVGTIAGSRCGDGTIRADQSVRVIRNGEVLHIGKISSLRRFQEAVREVQVGQECGVGVSGYEAFEPGDRLEFFHTERQSRVVSGGKVQPAPAESR